jgi:Icc-related predicted phosphoesterase
MSTQRVNRILCAADPGGSGDVIERLLAVANDRSVDAIALVGDLSDRENGFSDLFRALAGARRPVYWVPGAGDAPAHQYLREAHSIEVPFPLLHGVHGTAAFAPGQVLFAGIGGEISDDSHALRDEHGRLHYLGWEAEYRLKLLREFDYNVLVLLFWTPPAHKGRGLAGSEILAELVNTYRPRLVVCGGARGVEMLGRSLIVAPGSLTRGEYAVADLHAQRAELAELSVAVR